MTNGYIQIQVDGKPVGLKFAYPSIKWFEEAAIENKLVFFVGNDWSTEGFAKLVQAGYKNNCLLKEKKPDLDYEKLVGWVEETKKTESGLELLAEVFKCWAESTEVKEYLENKKKAMEEMEVIMNGLTSIPSNQ